MDPMQAFLSTQERFECKGLSAVLTRQQCAANKRRGDIFACEGCDGLSVVRVAPPAVVHEVVLRFVDPVDVDLYHRLYALSDDLQADIMVLLHLASEQRLYCPEGL